jgi:carbamoyl-phosphate synthase small subunit
VSLNDDVVEGLSCLDIPAFSVQYHPEAAAGPHDSAYLFDRFIDLMEDEKRNPGTTDAADVSKATIDAKEAK